jgi:cyanophycinase
MARAGRLLVMGGTEGRSSGSSVLARFVELAGARSPHVVLVTTAAANPDQAHAEYAVAFARLGLGSPHQLRLADRADADGKHALGMLRQASAVLFCGGDQCRLSSLVGSGVSKLLRRRLERDGLVIGGTSAGATALGDTMILGGEGGNVSAASVRTAPGLGLLPGVLIDMHFGQRGRLPRLLSAVSMEPELLGVGIDEDTAILVQGSRFEVLGSGAVTVLDGRGAVVALPRDANDPLTVVDVRLHVLRDGCSYDIKFRRPSIWPFTE